ncbi:glycosyltransferase family 2 protein [Nocardia sp. 004]|uniref:glycosyltransferase family 2 protein n=1 Tax=Nocardia sp. 004 TaxID=3385978 RepID=UPI0039A36CCF
MPTRDDLPTPGGPVRTCGVEVIIPVFDAAEYVLDCVASLARLTLRPERVIVVDDCSTDGSGRLAAAALTAAGIPVTVIESDSRGGPGMARNRGLAAATAALVWFVDADDVVAPEALRILLEALGEHDFAVCRTTVIDESGTMIGIDEPLPPYPVVSGIEYGRMLLHGTARAYAPTKLFRRALLPADPWDEVRRYEDMAAMVALAVRARSVALVPDAPYRYRRHDRSASRSFDPVSFELLELPARALSRMTAAGAVVGTAEAAEFTLREAVFPLAHLAMRAEAGPRSRQAVYAARRRIRFADLAALAGAGRIRPVAAAILLLFFPRWYARILRNR